MPTIETTLTQEQFDAVAAGLAADNKKTDAERVEAYFQGQHEAIAEQFVTNARKKEYAAVKLPEALANIALDADLKADLIAGAAAKMP